MIPYLYWINRALSSPLEALYTLLIFILVKEGNASPWHVTLLAASKPIVSLFSCYVNAFIIGRPERTRTFLTGLCLIGALPCLYFPFAQNPYFFIAGYALFMTTVRASFPIWIEIIKNSKESRQSASIILKGSSINYLTVMFLPLILSSWMDKDGNLWKQLFCIFGLIQTLALAVFIFLKPPISTCQKERASFLLFWKEGWNLLRDNPPFSRYQLMFFIGGAGLVAVQPILPLYFKETLHLSYVELTLAFSLCKGIAFVASSPYWIKCSKKISLYLINTWMNMLSLLFILLLIASSITTLGVFPAFLLYGAMQAGCELSWNLSGPYFASDKESTFYSSINLACVGLRGCICPFVGMLVYHMTSSYGVFILAAVLCAIGAAYASKLNRQSIIRKSDFHYQIN